MIEQTQLMPLLLQACASFESDWRAHLEEHGGEPLLYMVAGDFALRLLVLHRKGNVLELRAVADAIERFHYEGSAWVKEFATIGLLEAVQNVWPHEGADPQEFGALLGIESRRWWLGLNAFWDGKTQQVLPAS